MNYKLSQTTLLLLLSIALFISGCGRAPEKVLADIAENAAEKNWAILYEDLSSQTKAEYQIAVAMIVGMASAFGGDSEEDFGADKEVLNQLKVLSGAEQFEYFLNSFADDPDIDSTSDGFPSISETEPRSIEVSEEYVILVSEDNKLYHFFDEDGDWKLRISDSLESDMVEAINKNLADLMKAAESYLLEKNADDVSSDRLMEIDDKLCHISYIGEVYKGLIFSNIIIRAGDPIGVKGFDGSEYYIESLGDNDYEFYSSLEEYYDITQKLILDEIKIASKEYFEDEEVNVTTILDILPDLYMSPSYIGNGLGIYPDDIVSVNEKRITIIDQDGKALSVDI